MTEKAKGQSQAWDASGSGDLKEPSRLGIPSLQKGGGKAHQAWTARVGSRGRKRLGNYGDMLPMACDREQWVTQLNRYEACLEKECVCMCLCVH